MTAQRAVSEFDTLYPPRAAARFKPRPQPLPAPELDRVEKTPVGIDVLLDILSYRRAGDSGGEQAIIDKYIKPLAPVEDGYGNLFVTVGDEPSVAFTAHTDTVHSTRSPAVRQTLRLGWDGKMVGVKDDDCLGADDGTGVWILLNLITEGVPGLYCFYRDEESGRIGSEWSAENEPERYASIDIMISFDRAGTTDVITHQMGERCCSEEFAERIASAIDPSGNMAPDPTGSFTDSYSFLSLIPECTNISVGYNGQHTPRETQDLTWCSYLVTRLLEINFESLPVERHPNDVTDASLDYAAVLQVFAQDIADFMEYDYGIQLRHLVNDLGRMYGVTDNDIIDLARQSAQGLSPAQLNNTPKEDYAHDSPAYWPEGPYLEDEWGDRPGNW